MKIWTSLKDQDAGERMHSFAKTLFPINRSLMGAGVRETLHIVKDILPNLKINSIPSGSKVFDWTIPDEWIIHEAYIENAQGDRIIDFKNNNLHVWGYASSIDKILTREELQEVVYTRPDLPEAVPYITTYYNKRPGFCMSHNQWESLPTGKYKAVIKSEFLPGFLNYGELVIPGETEDEIFLSTYVCHPSMASNELSGPVILIECAKWLLSLPKRKYTYRLYWGVETLGAISYLSQNLKHMKEKVKAGFVLTCLGDERIYSYMPSRKGNTLADKVAKSVLDELVGQYRSYHFSYRGSDERQYCSPLVDLPVVSLMRSKYGDYPEYHSSLDNLEFMTPNGLADSLMLYKCCLWTLENNEKYVLKMPCEPQLGKRGLYPTTSTNETEHIVRNLMDVIINCDGTYDLIDLAKVALCTVQDTYEIIQKLLNADLVEKIK